ncbi:serine/threonine protein kinase [Zavarzinella formosa]|uniref:serine/threonine protein kinase n=1 Tax=Zavarzinella formosa TaxID=360055 RepID=UPI0002E7E4CD|nr:serine/threonine-protein kinase [Zavarzinella formosa]
MAEINEVIGGYRLRSLLQTGATSQVFEVVEPHSNRHFAMKVLLPESESNKELRYILFHEAEVGQKLRHENVIHILKVNRGEHSPHFIMEFFPSGSVRNRLMAKDFGFIKANAMKIFKQAATGLAYMHGNGWIHCDVKPDNMLVNAAGQLKMIDFAISKKIPKGLSKLFFKQAKAQGTPSYMSPEQIRKQPLDGRADIYSLGAMFYEMLTGRPPFRGTTMPDLLNKQLTEKATTPQVHNQDITDEFAALLLRMLAKKKEERPPACHDILIAMRKMKILKTDPDPVVEPGM